MSDSKTEEKKETECTDHFCNGFATKKGGTALLIIDPQNDFHEGGSLAVAGATKDTARIVKFIEQQGEKITQINVTLDAHDKMHIANPCYWVDKEGKNPNPFTLIKAEDIKKGSWKPARSDQTKHALDYVTKLEASGKFLLCIWPEHCIYGTEGQNIVPSLAKAINAWQAKTLDSVNYVPKGTNCLTEMFSALEAEVDVGDPKCQYNDDLLKRLLLADKVVVCGQALSHCVNFTVRDLVKKWPKESYGKLFIAEDGSSNVTGFSEKGDEFLKDMKNLGVQVMKFGDADKVEEKKEATIEERINKLFNEDLKAILGEESSAPIAKLFTTADWKAGTCEWEGKPDCLWSWLIQEDCIFGEDGNEDERRKEAIQIAIDSGNDINAQRKGGTPLDIAGSGARPQLVGWMKSKGFK